MKKEKYKSFPLIKTFAAKEGNTYLYDGRANIFLCLSPKESDTISRYLSLNESSEEEVHLNLSSDDTDFIKRLQRNNVLIPGILDSRVNTQEDNIERIWQQAMNDAVPKKVTLELTNACNLRCRYCPYTIHEENGNGKAHGTAALSAESGKFGIKNYFNSYVNIFGNVPSQYREYYLKRNPPAIGFYGGEALLQFGLMKELSRYARALPWEKYGIPNEKVMFHITTNGTLLTEEKLHFLIQNNFSLTISHDGPPEENDKNRIFKDGKGTSQRIEEVLSMIRRISEPYLLNNVQIQAVLAPNYDHTAVDSYFRNRTIGESIGGVKQLNYIEFSDYRNEHKQDRQLQEFDIKRNIFELHNAGLRGSELYKSLVSQPLVRSWLKFIYTILQKTATTPATYSNYFNSCFAGRANYFVDTKGNLHLCERTDFSKPIGNVADGINESIVKQMYADYFRIINREECRSCWAGHFCTLCMATLIKDGKIVPPNTHICNSIREAVSRQIQDLLFIKEYYPEILECMEDMYEQANDITVNGFKAFMEESGVS